MTGSIEQLVAQADLTCNRGIRDPEKRFNRGVEWWKPSNHRPELGPCLIYLGADNGNGYGQFRYNGHNGYAHRYAWERKHGPIPDHLTVDHLCRVRRCVNVEHLELVPRVENYLRAVRIRTHCPNGHRYTRDNLYIKQGREHIRICKTCLKATSQRGEEKRKNAAKGRPDGRIKYDTHLRDELVDRVLSRSISVKQAARQLGCSLKYMDKRVRIVAKSRGIHRRRAA